MKKVNPDYIEAVNRIVNDSPFFSLISMTIQELGLGWSVLEVALAEKHLQPFGSVHGGVMATVIDAATFWAVYCDLDDPETGLTSIDLKLNYLSPGRSSGRLIARGRQIKLGRSLGYADAEVRDDQGQLLAHGTSTLMVLPKKGLTAQPPLPPKFL
ncbi:MAG: PaaI family thioesterase [Deltaproteobacteria bacterium]|nr:PaaI family thioesterase [Deltaproteobacteria bacterium]